MSDELYWTLTCGCICIAAGMFTYGFLELREYMEHKHYPKKFGFT